MEKHHSNDEIDLSMLLKKISGLIESFWLWAYNSINFFFRLWYVFLALIIGGVLLGYFSEKNTHPDREATLLIRTNYNTARHAYTALETLLSKSKNEDWDFLTKHKFRTDTKEVKNFEIEPIINFRDIAEKVKFGDRTLELLMSSVEFSDDEIIPTSFDTEYKNHKLTLTLSNSSNEATIDNIISYLNSNNFIKEIAAEGRKNLESTITRNEFSIRQIDSTLANYNKIKSLPSSNNQIFVVDKNFNLDLILVEKSNILKENKILKEDLAYAKNAIVKINDSDISLVVKPIYLKNKFLYPVAFLFLFLICFWGIKKYKALKISSALDKE